MKLYRAYVETRSFTFEAFSQHARSSAVTCLREGLHKHAAKYSLDSKWVEEVAADISVTEYEIGRAYRDRSEIT